MEDAFVGSTAPLYEGCKGNVWAYNVAAMAERYPGGPPPELAVATYAISAPYAHPLWHSYFLCCVNLKPHPGAPAPVMHMPGATHEVFLYALNPDHPVNLNDKPRLLMSANFVAQFVAEDDAAAAARILQTAKDVADGILNPDTDYARHWIVLFGPSNLKGNPVKAGETIVIHTAIDGRTAELSPPPVTFSSSTQVHEERAAPHVASGGGGDFGGGGATSSWDSSSSDSGSSDSGSSSPSSSD